MHIADVSGVVSMGIIGPCSSDLMSCDLLYIAESKDFDRLLERSLSAKKLIGKSQS